MALIRHRQRALTAISPHNGNPNVLVPNRTTAIVPNRRATVTVQAVISGGSDQGGGVYRLTGPSATLTIGLGGADVTKYGPIGGRYRLYYDTIDAFVDGVLYDTPKGDTGFSTQIPYCADPLDAGDMNGTGGMIPSQNGEYFGVVRYRDVQANADPLTDLFEIKLCSDTAAGDYETYGNFRLERYLG